MTTLLKNRESTMKRRPLIEPIARVGLVSRGALYVMVGVLAVLAAMGSGGSTTDPRGAVAEVGRLQAGKPLLVVLALGLVAFAVWRVVQAIQDLDRKGRGLPALATRLGFLISGFLHLGLAATAAGVAITVPGSSVRSWVARALIEPLGVYAVAIAGAIVIGVGFEQFYRAWSMSFEKDLDMAAMSPSMKGWVGVIGRFGFSARGVTFWIVGWFLIRAARNVSAREVKDMGQALKVIGTQWHGDLLLGLVAAGTVAYGVMTFIEARYRRIVR
ncbi:MAG: DUF1206 domain-containing protein [Archangium sp.]|nr:DUF1206 domain-containing protein [Archangium sp.]MDP3157080.1 DUF1206 domain-containing protein [Archangium sp.]MDP3575797.1 DUF1206 domain-containing protein [Archangium sp.]